MTVAWVVHDAMHFLSIPTTEEAIRFMLVLALYAEDNPPDCQVTTTQTSAVITKAEGVNLACGKNRERYSLEEWEHSSQYDI